MFGTSAIPQLLPISGNVACQDWLGLGVSIPLGLNALPLKVFLDDFRESDKFEHIGCALVGCPYLVVVSLPGPKSGLIRDIA